MEVNLTVPAGTLLFRFFFNVESLNADSNGTQKFAPYAASDDIGTEEVARIAKWLRTKVYKPNGQGGFTIEAWSGKVKDNFVKRIKQVVEHYKGAGHLIINCEAYAELCAGLDGKSISSDDIEEA